ncbi:hypothetical protein ACS0TY_011859 [Phlomoides rotata]
MSHRNTAEREMLDMESMLGFNEYHPDDVVEDKSYGFKLVPWMSWDEWKFVRGSLFSSSPDSVASALQRISTWRSRGCVPVMVEVTASVVEIQHKDPYFRNDLNGSASQSEEMLSMLYCMAIMRLVNGVVEKTRKKNEISIGEAADAIGIPRMLIDIRHEASHRDLPSLQLLRLASGKALDWLFSYYWEPQEKAIPTQNNQTANLRKEIKRSLREVTLCLKAKQMGKSSSLQVKGKRSRYSEHLHGPSKLLHLVAGKSSRSNSNGSKKHLVKSLKKTLRLYSSSSTELVNILLEYLLNALDSSSLAEQSDDSRFVSSTEDKQTAFDDWKSVVLKLSRKEPEFLLTLTQAVLEKMDSNEAMNSVTGDQQSTEASAKSHQFELLSYLFEWLIRNLKTLNLVHQKESAESKGSKTVKHIPKETVLGLLRRCLLVSQPANKKLLTSSVTLAQLTGDTSLLQKLNKFALLEQPSNTEMNSINSFNATFLSQQEYSILEGEEKLEALKKRRMQSKPNYADMGSKSKWGVVKSWNPCPIGMLPHTIGFSGTLPILDNHSELETISNIEEQSPGKRDAEISIQKMDYTPVEKVQIEADCVMQDRDDFSEGIKGHLMINGVWKKVSKEELFTIASAVKLLV